MSPRHDPSRPPWRGIRDQFELAFDDWTFMDYLLVASPPSVVRDRIGDLTAGMEAAPGNFVYANFKDRFEEVRAEAARYLELPNRNPARWIALTDSTTMGLGLLYNGITVRPDQLAVTSDRAFMSTHIALQQRGVKLQPAMLSLRRTRSRRSAKKATRRRSAVKTRGGAKKSTFDFYRSITLYDDPASADREEMVHRAAKALSKKTRILALTWVHSNTGVKVPIAEIGRLVQKWNRGRKDEDRTIFCVDGVHGFAIETESFNDLHCDFFVSGCHKWLFGPWGTGFVCGRPRAWKQVSPAIASFMSEKPGAEFNTPGGIQTYPYRWALADAFRWHRRLGRKKVRGYMRTLCRRLKEGLSQVDGIRVLTPMSDELSAGIVCCDVEGVECAMVVEALRRARIVATVSSRDAAWVEPPKHVRFSPSILTTCDEIDETVEAMGKIAASVRRSRRRRARR